VGEGGRRRPRGRGAEGGEGRVGRRGGGARPRGSAPRQPSRCPRPGLPGGRAAWASPGRPGLTPVLPCAGEHGRGLLPGTSSEGEAKGQGGPGGPRGDEAPIFSRPRGPPGGKADYRCPLAGRRERVSGGALGPHWATLTPCWNLSPLPLTAETRGGPRRAPPPSRRPARTPARVGAVGERGAAGWEGGGRESWKQSLGREVLPSSPRGVCLPQRRALPPSFSNNDMRGAQP
jgi:hypothetical protein